MYYLDIYEKFGVCDPLVRYNCNVPSEVFVYLYGPTKKQSFNTELELRIFVKRVYPKQYKDLKFYGEKHE